MGLFDWVMNGIGFQADSDEEMPELETVDKPKKKKKRSIWGKKKKNQEMDDESPMENGFDFDQFNALKEGSEPSTASSYGGFTNSYGGFGGSSSYSAKNFVFFSPTNYEEIKKLVEYLKQGEPAIVNFDKISENGAQRSLDFISGAACALGGKLQRITGNFFLVTPDGYNITKPAGQDM